MGLFSGVKHALSGFGDAVQNIVAKPLQLAAVTSGLQVGGASGANAASAATGGPSVSPVTALTADVAGLAAGAGIAAGLAGNVGAATAAGAGAAKTIASVAARAPTAADLRAASAPVLVSYVDPRTGQRIDVQDGAPIPGGFVQLRRDGTPAPSSSDGGQDGALFIVALAGALMLFLRGG